MSQRLNNYYLNTATGFTNAKLEVSPNKGVNAWAQAATLILETPSPAPKPGELTRLTSQKQNNVVELQWKAVGEENVLLYEVERKEAGTNQFAVVGTVEPDILYTEITGYHYTDATVNDDKKYEYRVKQVKEKAGAKYTNIAIVDMGARRLSASIFHNPSKDVANINIENAKGELIQIQVLDAGGRKLATFKIEKAKNKVFALPVNGLKAGTYWVEVKSGEESKSVLLVKQ